MREEIQRFADPRAERLFTGTVAYHLPVCGDGLF